MAGARAPRSRPRASSRRARSRAPSGSSQRRSVTPIASRAGLQERDGAVDAAAHRDSRRGRRSAAARKIGPIAFASASTASSSPPTAAASSSVRPRRSRSSPVGVGVRRSGRRRRRGGGRSATRCRARSRRRPRSRGQASGTHAGAPRKEKVPHPADDMCRARANLASQVGALSVWAWPREAGRPSRTQAPFSSVLVLHCGRGATNRVEHRPHCSGVTRQAHSAAAAGEVQRTAGRPMPSRLRERRSSGRTSCPGPGGAAVDHLRQNLLARRSR